MNLRSFFILLVLLVFSVPASADFYRYIDENGNVRYTDDFSQVPVDQRPDLSGQKEFEGSTEAAEVKEPDKAQGEEQPAPSAPEKQDTTESGKTKPDQQETASKSELDQIKAGLESKKQELEKEYDAMMKEQQQLEIEGKAAKGNAQVAVVNEKIAKFEAKMNAYERKREAFNADVKEYNARVEQDLRQKYESIQKKE